MGASQSSETAADGGGKVCYYELLQVERNASSQEIRTAYRKLALVHHPDKNIGQENEAAQAFAEIQTAYEILSDPDQREWYDSHRDQILYGDNSSSMGKNPSATPRSGGGRGSSTAADLMKFFNPALFRVYDDSDKGMFAVARQIFQRLAEEERDAAQDQADDDYFNQRFPGFGDSMSSWEHHVRPFYASWSSFSSVKTFSYADQYRYSDAPDRRIRRAMEKENKRLREGARREYNDTVRAFVTFMKKRDPRVEKVDPLSTTEDRHQAQQQAVKAQGHRDRAAYLANAKVDEYQEPEWAKVDAQELEDILYGYDRPNDNNNKNKQDEQDTAHAYESDEEESIIEEFECLACNKTFKTEGQFNTHEKSKKHAKAVRQLRRQMLKEGIDLGVDDDVHVEEQLQQEEQSSDELSSNHTSEVDEKEATESDSSLVQPQQQQEQEQEEEEGREKAKLTAQDIIAELDALNVGGGVGFKATSNGVKPRKVKTTEKTDKHTPTTSSNNTSVSVGHACITCGARFSSKNRLFDHVNTMNHAAPPVNGGGKKNKTKNKKKTKK